MTERAQPGAIDSVVRNDELAQVLGQLTGGYDDGWIVPADDPTPAAQRRSDIDTAKLNAFAISTSASSLDVTVDGGEAFAAGWCALDEATTLSLPADATSTLVVTWDPDAIYDPNTDADRDAADSVVVDRAASVSGDAPRATLYDVQTDGSGVVGVTDRRQIGPSVVLETGSVATPPSSGTDIVRFADVSDISDSITAVGRNINNLTQEVARTQFELGLSELGYPTGFYDAFVDDSKVAQFVDTELDTEALVLLPPPDSIIEADESPFSGHSDTIRGISAPSGSGFGYSASDDQTVRKWDTTTMDETSESPFEGHGEGVRGIAVPSEEGVGYSSGVSTGTIRKWDTGTMTEVAESPFNGHTDGVVSLFVDADVSAGFSAGFDNTVRKWDTETMTEVSESPFSGHSAAVYVLDVDTESGFGYSGSGFDDYTLRKWDTATMTEASESPYGGHSDTINAVAVPSGTDFGYSSDSNNIQKWESDTLSEVSESPFGGHTDSVEAIVIDTASGFGYSAAADGTVRKWDTDTMTEAPESPFNTSNTNVYSLSVPSGSDFGYSGGTATEELQKWVKNPKGATNGSATTPFKDIGFVPDRLVIGRDATLPTNTTLNYKVEDDQGNVETFSESEVDTEVSLPSISSSNVRTTLVLERDSADDPTPELNSYALYLSE